MHQEFFLMGVVFWGEGLCLHANDWKVMLLASFPGLLHLQFLIACSMHMPSD